MIVDFNDEDTARGVGKVKIRFLIFIDVEEVKSVYSTNQHSLPKDFLPETEFTATFESNFWSCKSFGMNFMAETAKEVAKRVERYLVLNTESTIVRLLTIDITQEEKKTYEVYIGCEEWQDFETVNSLQEVKKYFNYWRKEKFTMGLYHADEAYYENVKTGEKTDVDMHD